MKQCFLSLMSVNFIWSQFSLLFSVGFFFKQEDKIKTQLENLSHVHLTNLTIPTILTRQDVETMRYKKNKYLKMILGNTIRLEMNCWWNITAHLSLTRKRHYLLNGWKWRINQIKGTCVTKSSMNYKKKITTTGTQSWAALFNQSSETSSTHTEVCNLWADVSYSQSVQ